MTNPLLQEFKTPFEIPPFPSIKIDHFIPAIKTLIDETLLEIDIIAGNSSKPTFENTIEALENTGKRLGIVSGVLYNLNAAETSEELQKITQEASPILTEFDNTIKQNAPLFKRIKEVHSDLDSFQGEKQMLLDKTYKGFVRSGADLDEASKKRYKEIASELATLSLKFGENVLAETNSFELIIDDQKDLSGLPEDVMERAAGLADQKGKSGKWIITLQAPSYIPFMEYADNRQLREQLFRAYMKKAFKGDQRDNKELVRKLASLRAEKARLLGFETYATYVLEERMAEKPEYVVTFLNDLLEKARPKAEEELKELKAFMKDEGVAYDLQRWDWAYYSEKLRKRKYDLDDELIKPYFKLENVIDGAFLTAGRLFGLTFQENSKIPVYHPDVTAYEVKDSKGDIYAIFFADFFPREGKRSGAWMTSYRNEYRDGNARVIPHISIVCNFTPSTPKRPSLLKFDEVKTLFHEFGHALHGMLADTSYESLSGTHVYWDFVELPSQVFENWCFERECLDMFAKHHQTGEKIPDEYIRKLVESANYHEGYATLRQLSFGLLDFAYHHNKNVDETLLDISGFESKVLGKTDLFPSVDGTNMSVQFSHIFAGGYGAGYYSYKWSEVLDADAFSLFQEKGIFDKKTAESFKNNILSQGGTAHPMDLYVKFRGRKPNNTALLNRAGLAQ